MVVQSQRGWSALFLGARNRPPERPPLSDRELFSVSMAARCQNRSDPSSLRLKFRRIYRQCVGTGTLAARMTERINDLPTAIDWLRQRIADRGLDVKSACARAGVSHKSFYQVVKNPSNMSSGDFIRLCRSSR